MLEVAAGAKTERRLVWCFGNLSQDRKFCEEMFLPRICDLGHSADLLN